MGFPRNTKQKLTHEEYISRITKTLCYTKMQNDNFATLPVIELASEIFSSAQKELTLDYLSTGEAAHLCRSIRIPPHTLVFALIYLDRIKSTNPKYLAKVSPSKLFLISMMIGSKFLGESEESVFNDEWSIRAGITLQEINQAEREFLAAINWNVYVDCDEFWAKFESMEKKVCLRQALQRGWVSYTEMLVLLNSEHLSAVLNFLNMAWVCLLSYTVSVATLLGSAMLISQLLARPASLEAKTPIIHNQSMEIITSSPDCTPQLGLDLTSIIANQSEHPEVYADCNLLKNELMCDKICFSASHLFQIKQQFDLIRNETWSAGFKTILRNSLPTRSVL